MHVDQDDVLTLVHDGCVWPADYQQDFEPLEDFEDQPLPPLTGLRFRDSRDISPFKQRISTRNTQFATDSCHNQNYPEDSSPKFRKSEYFRDNHSRDTSYRESLAPHQVNIMPKSGPKRKTVVAKHRSAGRKAEKENNVMDNPPTEEDTESEPEPSPASRKAARTLAEESENKLGNGKEVADFNDEKDFGKDPRLDELVGYLANRNTQDRKTKADNRLVLIMSLRKKIYCKQQLIYHIRDERTLFLMKSKELQQVNDRLEEEKGTLEATVQEFAAKFKDKEREYNELKAKFNAKLSELTSRRKRPSPNGLNKSLMDLLEVQAKGVVFSKCKFVTNEKQELNLGKLMWKYGGVPKEHKEDRNHFIHTYSAHIKKAVFDQRSYVQTEFRKIFFKCKKKGEHFPTVEELTKCIARDINTEDEFKVFMYYCEEFLGKMVGASEWSVKTRCFTTISAATRQNMDVPLISPSDEAFVALVVDNCYKRWDNEAKEEGTRPPDAPKPKKIATNGKYRVTDGGQSKYGGWNGDGIAKYNELLAMTKEARKSERCKQVEECCLQLMQAKHKITGKSWAEHTKRNKSRQRARDEGANEDEPPKMLKSWRRWK